MTEAGFPWERFTVQNLESGRRKSVSLDEAIALARVLQVAFVYLALPIDGDPQIEVGAESFSTSDLRAWMRGSRPLGADHRWYYTEVPG